MSDARPSFFIKDLPKYEDIRARSVRYPAIDPAAVEACLTLLRVSTDVLNAFNVRLARHGMTTGRFAVLTILNRDPDRGLRPSELADRAGVTRATMTGLLAALRRDKLVVRTGDRADRRRAVVQLTPRGRQFLDAVMPDYFDRIAALMRHLPEPDKRLLTDMLHKVSQGIAAING